MVRTAHPTSTKTLNLLALTLTPVIANIDIWLDMRDIRNRMAHDYTPEKIAEMYKLIRHEFYEELNQLEYKIKHNHINSA